MYWTKTLPPDGPNKIWVDDVSDLHTGKGWMYLAIVIDLYSNKIIGCHMIDAYNLGKAATICVLHFDRESQYTSKCFAKWFRSYNVWASMIDYLKNLSQRLSFN